MASALTRLSAWYLAQCDGLWEHGQGLSITTIDNPGFALKIDLKGTPLQDAVFDRVEVEFETDENWYTCWKEDCIFHTAGAPSRVENMIECFLDWSRGSPGRAA